jgi:hypothetical protein
MKALSPFVPVFFLILGAPADAVSGAPDFDGQRLQSYPTQALIGLLATGHVPRNAAQRHAERSLIRELAQRHAVTPLLTALAVATDYAQTRAMIAALRLMHDANADAGLRQFLSGADTRNYLVAMSFGADCDTQALAALSRNYALYSVSSAQRAGIADIFGKCDYEAAVPNLLATLHAASVNLGEASFLALGKIYPDVRLAADDSLDTAAARWHRRYLLSHRH